MPTMKVNLRSLFLIAATFFCVTGVSYAQAIGPTIEAPATHNGDSNSALIEIPTAQQNVTDSSSASNVTMAGEYKSTKNVVEQEKPPCGWNWYVDVGYFSQYNFRGTNLTPDADGAMFFDADVSKWGFTLGMFYVHQLGIARAPGWSLGEGGGGSAVGALASTVGVFSPETVQSEFSEIDVFLQYRRDFGPINVTVGNIGFFVERKAETFLNTQFFGLFGPYPTVGDEQFDRLFVRLATSVIPHIEPWITYYQTVYNDGQDHNFYIAPHIPPNGTRVKFGRLSNDNFHERNDRLGGYLEGRLRGNFAINKWIDFNPYGVISYSFNDRTEPLPGSPRFRDIIRGRSLSGFNVAQVGVELPIRLWHFVPNSTGRCMPSDVTLSFVPFGAYSYHISDPTPGTDRNELWGGAKFALTF